MSRLPFDESTGGPPPQSFGPHRVLHQIGSGVLGPVFRTYESHGDRLVAVKSFRLDLLPQDVARLADALRRLAATVVDAPALVPLIDAGLEGVTAFLAMEYISGETWDVALRRLAPAPLSVALPILAQIAAAIDAAWTADPSLGHGSLHPRDVFVATGTNEVTITGFGISPILETLGVRAPLRRPYTAPERYANQAWGIRADIFSLGALAHELLTGRRPAGPGEQDGALPATMPPAQRVQIRRVLSAALAEHPSHRFATAHALVEALEAAGRGEAVALDFDSDVLDATEGSPERIAVDEQTDIAIGAMDDEGDPTPDPDVASDLGMITPAALAATEPALEALDALPVRATHDAPHDSRMFPLGPMGDPENDWRDAPIPPPTPPREPFTQVPRTAMFGDPSGEAPPAHALFSWGALAAVLIAGLAVGGVGGYAIGTHERPAAAPTTAASTSGPEALPTTTDVQVAQSPSSTSPSAPTAAAPSATGRATTSPAPGAPAETSGRLLLHSDPAGASVTVDARPQGKTPAAIRDLAFGAHSVTVSHPGYEPETRRFALSAADPAREMTIPLRASHAAAPARGASVRGSIDIDSRPGHARVIVDGKPAGVTPLHVPDLLPGDHKVQIELTGYKTLATTVHVTAGEPAHLAVTLEQGGTR